MGMMGIDVDVLGNHSFDHGQTYLRTELIPLAPIPDALGERRLPGRHDAAGVVEVDGARPRARREARRRRLHHRVDARDRLPGEPRPVRGPARRPGGQRRGGGAREGTDAILALGHEGASSGTVDNPSGPLIDIADNVTNVDAVIGDHNDVQVDALRANGVLVTENRGKGIRFTRMRLVIGPGNDGVVYKTADFHKPWNIGLTPDPAIQAKINELNAQLAPILGTQIGSSTKFIPRADQCGRADGRLCESFVGNVVTDAMRTRYSAIGVQFAITNSGGLRDALTCPTTDLSGDFCPAYTPPPFPITRGQSLAVLPFGNIVVTLDVNGAELKTMLENGVSLMPAVDGPLPAGIGPLLHLQHRRAVGQPGDLRGGRECGRQLHRDARRPDGGGRPTRSPRTTSWRPAATDIRTSPAG